MADIDLVIPMVFPADPVWLQEYTRYKSGADAASHVRFRSWGTEELLLRCCLKNMPWLRTIHIILSGPSQVQPWMQSYADGSRVRLVFHGDFMPSEALPCFTSPTIEMFLGDIPCLAGQFIYINDDMFPLSPLSPDDFFRDGLACERFIEKTPPAVPNIFQRKCLAQQAMIASGFGIRMPKVWLKADHSFAPIFRSSCREVLRRHRDDIMRHLSPLRRTDRSYNHYIYLLYQHFAGLTADHSPAKTYVEPQTPLSQLGRLLCGDDAGIVCVNDNESISDWQRRAAVVRSLITSKLETP
jgi:hypothetical protein